MKKPKWRFQFYKGYQFRWRVYFHKNKLMWKDKFETPRCEREPSFTFEWLWFGIYGSQGDDDFWEQWLWVYEYYHGDYQKAKEEWPWVDCFTKKSTWIDYGDK